jgi:transcriptional regulator with XRE-family HTH domain
MENAYSDNTSIDQLIAQRLKLLRAERGWSLDELAKRSNVSRATLSRLENAEVSPTASVLGKICAAYGLTMSRLMYMVEDNFVPLICRIGLDRPDHRVPAAFGVPSRSGSGCRSP